jgi:hypothetical protein
MPTSRRTRAARSTMKAISVSGRSFMSSVLEPRLRSARSSMFAFVIPATDKDSSNCTPWSFRLSEPMRLVSGYRSGQTVTDGVQGLVMEAHPIFRLPPQSSVRLFASREKKLTP